MKGTDVVTVNRAYGGYYTSPSLIQVEQSARHRQAGAYAGDFSLLIALFEHFFWGNPQTIPAGVQRGRDVPPRRRMIAVVDYNGQRR
jgi:hypothetical protein